PLSVALRPHAEHDRCAPSHARVVPPDCTARVAVDRRHIPTACPSVDRRCTCSRRGPSPRGRYSRARRQGDAQRLAGPLRLRGGRRGGPGGSVLAVPSSADRTPDRAPAWRTHPLAATRGVRTCLPVAATTNCLE